MSTIDATMASTATANLEFATFFLGDLWLGVDIQAIQEINADLDVTSVPHTPESVAGVVNLRGDVVTIVDLRVVFGLEPCQITNRTRNVIVTAGGEKIGLLVDRVGDVVVAKAHEIDSNPANIEEIAARFLAGVYQGDDELLAIVDTDEVLRVDESVDE